MMILGIVFLLQLNEFFSFLSFLKYWQHQCKPHQNNVETEINSEMIEIDTLAAKYHEIVRHAEPFVYNKMAAFLSLLMIF
jgi:hypothetical protein